VLEKKEEQKELVLLLLDCRLLEKLKADRRFGKRAWAQLAVTGLSTAPTYRII